MGAVCSVCGKAAMYTVKVSGKSVCEDCVTLARAITDPEARRAAYSGLSVTLDREPAKVAGFMLDFAWVAPLNPDKPAREYAWATVAHIVSRGGRFSS